MLVAEILPLGYGHFATIEAHASVQAAAGLMAEPKTDLILVCRKGVLLGVVTKSDIVTQVGRNAELGLGAEVHTIMTQEVTVCRSTDLLPDVWQTMKRRRLQRIPVVNDSHEPIGIVYASEALQKLLDEIVDEDEMLRRYISGVGYR